MTNAPPPPLRLKKCNKHYAPFRCSRYNSRAHTIPDKRDASAMSNPPPRNQQACQEIQDKKNGDSTTSPDTSIADAVLWLLLLKNLLFESL